MRTIYWYLRLARVPNAFTAMADVAAGCFITIGPSIDWRLLQLILASAAIYSGGCVLNDICDRRDDATRRPERPIPSGKVTAGGAVTLVLTLFLTGLYLSFLAGAQPLVLGSVIAALVLAYDLLSRKSAVLGPLNMGALRALNIVFGMSALPFTPDSRLIFPAITFLLVVSITVLARFETNEKTVRKGFIIAAWCTAIVAVLILKQLDVIGAGAIVFIALYGLYTGVSLNKAFHSHSSGAVASSVSALILGIPLLDASYAAGTMDLFSGLPVALFFIPAYVLSKVFPVT